MSTQSVVPVGAYCSFTEATPRWELPLALSETAPIRGVPGGVRLTVIVLKSAAAVIEPVEYELAVKSAPDALAPPPSASAARMMSAARLTPPPPRAPRDAATGRPG